MLPIFQELYLTLHLFSQMICHYFKKVKDLYEVSEEKPDMSLFI